MTEIDINGKRTSGDPAMRRVIDAQAQVSELREMVKALKADRDQLISEYKDLRDARPVKPTPAKPRKAATGESVRVSVGDVHGMMMDRPAVGAFLSDLKTLDPDVIVLGGDIVECGGWLAKHQPVGFVALCDYTYQEDMRAANWFLDEVQAAAPRAEIHYLEGNHEDRVERWATDAALSNKRDAAFLLDAFGPQAMLRLKERGIRYYRRSHNHVKGLPLGWIKLGKMFYTHQLGTGKNAARSAALKTAWNVTFFDTHREDTASVRYPGVGIIKAFNPGCLCTLQPVWKNSDPTEWSHGYAIDIIAKSGNFQRIHVPIQDGESLANAMITRFKS